MIGRKRISLVAVLVPLAAALAVITICGLLYLSQAAQQERALRERQTSRVDVLAHLWHHEFQMAISDLLTLSDGDGLHAYLDSGLQTNLDRAIHRAIFFSRLHTDYDKLRFIDTNGQEVLRVNWHGAVVPPAGLQSKSNRPFVQESLGLQEGRIFVSALDLNIENGVVEQPLKPEIRFATPVFDIAGTLRGVYVINYRATNLLTELQRLLPTQQQVRLLVLNSQGYWLKADDPAQEWGFMLPDRHDMTLAKTDPALWSQILRQPSGQTRAGGGLFTWLHFKPADPHMAVAHSLVSQDQFLVLASEVSAADWAATFGSLRRLYCAVAIALVLLISVSSWLLRDRARAFRERDLFFDLTPDLLCIAGFDGYFKRLNPSWEKVFGHRDDELMAKPFMEFVHPDDRERTLAEYNRQAAGSDAISFENRYRCKDGSYRWLLWNAHPILNEGIIVASARDVSGRKFAEQERDQFFLLSRDWLCIAGFDGVFRRVNPAMERTLGYTEAELTGRPLQEFVHPDDREASHARVAEMTRTGVAMDFRDRYICKDGTIRWVSWRVTTDLDLRRIFCVARDVTELRATEEQVRALNEELKVRASQLQAANRELESFSYSVSHDLRAPLRHINGFVDLLGRNSKDRLDDKSQRYLEIIAGAARQMGDLIDDLLAFSRMSRAELRRTGVPLDAMVRQTIEGLQMDIRDRHIDWKISPLPQVSADPAMLRLVWSNLIANAVKYTRPRGTAVIEIGCADDGDGEHVIFVRDNGVGFDMQYVDKLYGVFQRLHSSDDFEGTGIGLANVRRIISRHGGRTWAEGKVDHGAVFYFSLPKEPEASSPQV